MKTTAKDKWKSLYTVDNRIKINEDTPLTAKCGFWCSDMEGIHCSKCNHKLETTDLPRRCPHCYSFMV